MSFIPLGKPKRPRGRPKGSFIRNREVSVTAMRISHTLKEILESEKKQGETLSETNLRLLRERTQAIGEYRKKAEALEERLTQYITIEANK